MRGAVQASCLLPKWFEISAPLKRFPEVTVQRATCIVHVACSVQRAACNMQIATYTLRAACSGAASAAQLQRDIALTRYARMALGLLARAALRGGLPQVEARRVLYLVGATKAAGETSTSTAKISELIGW
jgi:hypothetical protein